MPLTCAATVIIAWLTQLDKDRLVYNLFTICGRWHFSLVWEYFENIYIWMNDLFLFIGRHIYNENTFNNEDRSFNRLKFQNSIPISQLANTHIPNNFGYEEGSLRLTAYIHTLGVYCGSSICDNSPQYCRYSFHF